MYLENPVIVEVTVSFNKDIVVKDYTAKLIKSLLISGNPKLEELFSKSVSIIPKPIHITPLYAIEKTDRIAKLKAVYTKFVPKGSTAKPPELIMLEPVNIEGGREYSFLIGISIHSLEEVLRGLTGVERFVFGNRTVEVDSLSYELHYIDVEKESESIKRGLEERNTTVKVTFMSPTVLVEPLTIVKKRKKFFLPTPSAVFFMPFVMVLFDVGKLRKSLLVKAMHCLESVLSTPYTALKTVDLVWYVYDNDVLPALIGYIKYFVDHSALSTV